MAYIDMTPELTALAEEVGAPQDEVRELAASLGYAPMVGTPPSLNYAFAYFNRATDGNHVAALITAFYMLNNYYALQEIRRKLAK